MQGQQGSFRIPGSCTSSADCNFLVTYQPLGGDRVVFEMSGRNNWAGIGFSNDDQMVNSFDTTLTPVIHYCDNNNISSNSASCGAWIYVWGRYHRFFISSGITSLMSGFLAWGKLKQWKTFWAQVWICMELVTYTCSASSDFSILSPTQTCSFASATKH